MTTGLRTASITGTGSYVPERILTNKELEKLVDTTDEWILTRTGIRERHIAREDEPTSAMAAIAARRALEAAGIGPEAVDLIVVATITPDMGFPNTACFVQREIGAVNAFCYDIEAACSGFVYALDLVAQYVVSGRVETALVIGAEKISCITDWSDRSLCVLFGDGAGAAVVQSRPDRRGVMGAVLKSDGRLADLLKLPGGGSRHPASEATLRDKLHFMKMDGKEVFKHAVNCMTDVARRALEKAGVTLDQVTLVIPHQANMRIVKAIRDRLGGRDEQYCVNVERFGNTSAASVILALDEAARAGRVKRGDLVLLVAFGGGFTWGAAVLEW